jgi:GTP-binding protein
MVPGDTDDIKKEYQLLLNELQKFNPEMLQKHRVLAVTKCDLLDEELIEMLRKDLPEDLQVVFISSVTGMGINDLKDILWKELNAESNKIQGVIAEDTLVHRDKDLSFLADEVFAEDRNADTEIGALEETGEEVDMDIIDEENVDEIEDFEYI